MSSVDRLRRAFGLTLLAPVWPALGAWLGPDTITIGLSQIDAVLGRRFPLRRRLLDVLEFELAAPALQLLPQDNRMGAELHLQITDPASGQRAAGVLSSSFGLRYAAQDASVRLTQPRLEHVEFDAGQGASGALDPKLLQSLAPIVTRLLDNAAIYRLKPEQVAMMRRAGVQPGELRVTPLGVEIHIEPMPAPADSPPKPG
jgi:hypothetical protein